jgi:hypothetical protein
MRKIFNLNRFGRLFYKHTTEHYKSYLMSLIVLLGILLLGGGFLVYMADIPIDEEFQTVLFMVILLLSGTIFTSTVFADLGDKKKAIAWLTLPATHIEKYMVAWVYTVLVFLVVYTISFYGILMVAINMKHFTGHTTRLFNVFRKPVYLICLLYAFLHGVAFWGAVFFKRLHFIKTAFIFFIFLAIIIFFNKIMLGTLLGRAVEAAPPFGNLRLVENGSLTDINISQNQQNGFVLTLLTVLALIFWVAAFYRLKEKQV